MFRFTIRDVLWLMVVVALAVGWLIDHRRIGLAPAHLQTLIGVLSSHGISVRLESKGVSAEMVPGNDVAWNDYHSFGSQP